PLLLALRRHPDPADVALAVGDDVDAAELDALLRVLGGHRADLVDVGDLAVLVTLQRGLRVLGHVLDELVAGLLDDEDDLDRLRRLRVVALEETRDRGVPGGGLQARERGDRLGRAPTRTRWIRRLT